MTTTPDEPLGDDDMTTAPAGDPGTGGGDADGTDGGGDADGTDGDASDSDGTDGDASDVTDGDAS